MASVNPLYPSPKYPIPQFLPPSQLASVKPKVISVPVKFAGLDENVTNMNHSDAAIKIQKLFRGFLVRRILKVVCKIEEELNEIELKFRRDGDMDRIFKIDKERLLIGEMLMRLLFRLDSVRGVWDCSKRIIQRVVSIQEVLDSISSGNQKPEIEESKVVVTEETDGCGNQVTESNNGEIMDQDMKIGYENGSDNCGAITDSVDLSQYREMSYPSLQHPEHDHALAPIGKGRIFRCNGCFELGSENHYMCTHPESNCDFHLHIACAEAHKKPPIKQALYGDGYLFEFREKPVNENTYCDACGKRISRYYYSCSGKNLDLHPSCTTEFPLECKVNGVPVELKKNINGKKCMCCQKNKYGGGRLDTWAYISKSKSEEKQYFAGCLQNSLMRKNKEAFSRNGSDTSSQVNHNSSLYSRNGSAVSTQAKPNKTPELLCQIVELTVNSFNQGVTLLTAWPLGQS